MTAPHPRMHGITHVAGGPDPIPNLPAGSPGGDTFSSVVLSTADLLAYWRLGETGEPWLDTSGQTAYPADADLTLINPTGADPVPNVAGGLEPAQDDGAVQFVYDGVTEPGSQLLYYDDAADRFALGVMTVAAWVKVQASATARAAAFVGNTYEIVSSPNYVGGWSLQAVYPGLTLRFSRGQTSGGGAGDTYAESAPVTADQWYFVVGTYDMTQIRLYVDGVLVDETAETSGAWSAGHIMFGAGEIPGLGSTTAFFYGTVDETAIWTRALSAGEIAALYDAGSTEAAAAGSYVLVSDGDGGSSWGKVADANVADGADIAVAKLVAGTDGQVLSTVAGTAAWAAAGAGGDPAADTAVWMPLTTVSAGVPELVWDGDDSLIPTLTPI